MLRLFQLGSGVKHIARELGCQRNGSRTASVPPHRAREQKCEISTSPS